MLKFVVFLLGFTCVPAVNTSVSCKFDGDCNNGSCRLFTATDGYCVCNNNYTSRKDLCDYHQVSKLEAFLLSFFTGFFGVDWFVLAKGHASYIVAGVFKILTVGGLGVWWLVSLWLNVET